LEKYQSTEIYTYHTISLDLLVTQVLASKTCTKRKKLRNTGSLMNFSVHIDALNIQYTSMA